MLDKLHQNDLFQEIISTCIDPQTNTYKESAGNDIIQLLKVKGYEVEGKSPEELKEYFDQEIVSLISEPLDITQKKVLGEISLLLGAEFTVVSDGLSERILDTFCGISLHELTQDQKSWLNKLSQKELDHLGRVLDFTIPGQIGFRNTPRGSKAIQSADSIVNINKVSANIISKYVDENGWNLPEETLFHDRVGTIGLKLLPDLSDFDALISMMPGKDDNEKVKGFRALINMWGWYYRTSDSSFKPGANAIVRQFLDFNWGSASCTHGGLHPFRLIRPLKKI